MISMSQTREFIHRTPTECALVGVTFGSLDDALTAWKKFPCQQTNALGIAIESFLAVDF